MTNIHVLSQQTKRFLAILKDALVGTERDLTKGPLPAAIISIAIPMVLEGTMAYVYKKEDARSFYIETIMC